VSSVKCVEKQRRCCDGKGQMPVVLYRQSISEADVWGPNAKVGHCGRLQSTQAGGSARARGEGDRRTARGGTRAWL
jgi:hypothetical protein